MTAIKNRAPEFGSPVLHNLGEIVTKHLHKSQDIVKLYCMLVGRSGFIGTYIVVKERSHGGI